MMSEKPPLPLGPMVRRPAEPMSAQRRVREPA